MSKRTFAVLFACFCTILAAYSIRYSYGTLLPEMLPSLGISKAQAGIIYSSYFIAYTLLSPVMGMLSDRFDMRILLAVFVPLMGVGTFLMQYPTSVPQASMFFTIAGIGCAACWAPVVGLAQRWIGDKRRGLGLSVIDAGSALGVMVAGSLVPLVVAGAGWRTGWMILGILAIVLGAMNYILVRNDPKSENKQVHGKSSVRSRMTAGDYKLILKIKEFWFIGLAYLLTGFSIIIPFTFLSTYAVQELSLHYETATLLVTLIGAGGITGKLTLGPLSDKLGRVRIMVLCAVLITGGCVGMAYGRGSILMVICFIYGVGYGACWAMYAACASDFFSKQAAGGIIGLWTFLMGLGSIGAPIIAGWVADATGTLMWAFIIATAGGLGSLLLILPMLRVPQGSLIQK